MRIILFVLVFSVLLALLAGSRNPVAAQAARAAVGGAVGVAGGAVITMSVVVARARLEGTYVASADDLMHWQSMPMILTPAVGVMFGLAGREPLTRSVIGSTSGLLAGAAVGAGIGWMLSPHQEGPWAGAVIGAGAGMTIGGLLLGILAWRRGGDGNGDPPPVAHLGFSIPL